MLYIILSLVIIPLMNNNITMETTHVLFNLKKGEYELPSRATMQMQRSPKSLLMSHDLSLR